MRDNFYMTAILICTCIMLLAGLAFTGLELLQYARTPREGQAAVPARERAVPPGETPETRPPAAPTEEAGETQHTPPSPGSEAD